MIGSAKYYAAFKNREPVYLIKWPFDEPWRITGIAETSDGFIYEIENIVTGTTINVKGREISLNGRYGKPEEEKSMNKEDVKNAKFYQEYINKIPVYRPGSDAPLYITKILINSSGGGYQYVLHDPSTNATVSRDERYIKNTPNTPLFSDLPHVSKFGPPRTSYNQALKLTNIGIKYLLIPKRIIFSGPCTIILWEDGTKTMARVLEGETFDPEKGVAICFMKKMLGHTETNKILREAHNQYREEN